MWCVKNSWYNLLLAVVYVVVDVVVLLVVCNIMLLGIWTVAFLRGEGKNISCFIHEQGRIIDPGLIGSSAPVYAFD